MVNHFEFHYLLTQKDTLLHSMTKYFNQKQENVFNFLPLTFCIDTKQKSEDYDYFMTVFQLLEKNKIKKDIQSLNQVLKNSNPLKEAKKKKKNYELTSETFWAGQNIWLIKPVDCNRGRGVFIFESLPQLNQIMYQFQQGYEASKKPLKPQFPQNIPQEQLHKNFTNLEEIPDIIKSSKFVLQKYIEQPLLLKGRKFDIRVLVLLTQKHECFVYKEGYCRTSSELFSLDQNQS